VNASELFAQPGNTYALVLGLDLSPMSKPAVREALGLLEAVREPNLHVVYAAGRTDRSPAEKQAHEAQVLERLQRALGDVPPERVTFHVRFVDATSAILDVAREVDADLIVVGTRFGTSKRSNSVSEALMHAAQCPVLAVYDRAAADEAGLHPEA
jgi:nucleotide-binding universal stress UspA family protein